ncbi:MAG: MarC family protein [Actinomycetota bacterium]
MDDLLPLAIAVFIVLDPVATISAAAVLAPEPHARRRAMAVAVLVGGGLLAIAAAIARPLLDALDISPPAALLTAGIVVLVPALDHLWPGPGERVQPDDASPTRLGVFPLGVPVLASPAAVVAVVAWSAAEGRGVTLTALAVACVFVAAVAGRWSGPPPGRPARVAGAFAGVAMALIAFDLIRDGVFAT